MSTSYPLYICCREFPGVPRGDYLLATGARCSPKPRRMTFAGGCSPMLSRMELPAGGLPSRRRRSVFPGGEASDPKTQSSKAQLFYGSITEKKAGLFFCNTATKKRHGRCPCLCVFGSGGERGIRTPGTHKGSTVFETAPFDRSGISPFISGAGFVVWI